MSYVGDLHDLADSYSNQLGIPPGGVNDDRDAFRHAFASAVMARDYGVMSADIAGTLWEYLGLASGEPLAEARMDSWNNFVGQQIADRLRSRNGSEPVTDDQIANEVLSALNEGRLIRSPQPGGGGDMPDISGDPFTGMPWPGSDEVNQLFDDARPVISPIALDLDGSGSVDTVGLTGAIHFDHDANNHAQATAWVAPTDGFLVWDRDGNGQIDSGRELFGSETLLANGAKAADGFAALFELDANQDAKIDASDAGFDSLQVWVDSNQNGVTDTGELHALAEYGIVSFDANLSVGGTDANGVQHQLISSFTRQDGSTGLAEDLWFPVDQMNSVTIDRLTVSVEVAALPRLSEFGNVYDLHQAIMRDATGTLKQMADELATTPGDEIQKHQLARQLLFKWAESENADPTSRGSYIDARVLVAVEHLVGRDYTPSGANAIGSAPIDPPGVESAKLVDDIFAKFEQYVVDSFSLGNIHSALEAIQLNFGEAGDFSVDMSGLNSALNQRWADNKITGIADLLRIDRFAGENLAAWGWNPQALLSNWGMNGVTVADLKAYRFVSGSTGTLDGAAFNELLIGTAGNDTITDAGGNDVLVAGAGDDAITLDGQTDSVIYAEAGDDTVMLSGYGSATVDAGDGNDAVILGLNMAGRINGGAGNDVLTKIDIYGIAGIYNQSVTFTGGTGDDTLTGGSEADTYIFNRGDGQDFISDVGYSAVPGMDRLVFGAGIVASDIVASRENNNLVLRVNDPANPFASDLITIEGWDDAGRRIESIEFADGTVLTATALTNRSMLGTDGADTLTLWSDTTAADGKGGDDTIEAWVGDAAILGGEGDDQITVYGSGVTQIDGGIGNDRVNLYGYGETTTLGGDGNDTLILGTNTAGRLEGGTGDDVLTKMDAYGLAGQFDQAVTFVGGTGDDTITAGSEADTYVFNRGDGHDTVLDNGYGGYPRDDSLQFGIGSMPADAINAEQLWFQHIGDDLEVSVVGTLDTMTIKNWYIDPVHRVEQFRVSDGQRLLDSQVENLVQAMASFAPPAAGQTTLPQNYQDQLGSVIAANWQ